MAGALGLYVVGTRLITRDRPPVPIPTLAWCRTTGASHWGHVIAAVVVYGSTALLISLTWPRVRRWMRLLLLVPLAVAVARMYQGAHHPTDVLASLVFSAAWVAVVAGALLSPTDPHRRWSGRSWGLRAFQHTDHMGRWSAHDAVVVMEPAGDERAPGACITVALCGHWDH